jgi:photosystem II stability/assembly factor-like uncharacterized protein
MRRTTFSLGVVAATALIVANLAFAAPTVAGVASRPAAGPTASVTPSWRFTPTATTKRLVVVDVVNPNMVWAAGGSADGTDGVVVRTVDGGQSWRDVTPPGGDALDFRDVEAYDDDHAVVLAAGEGTASRIYRTADGGATWQLEFVNQEPAGFYDCMAFFDPQRGVAVSDPIDGKFRIISTQDGGDTWSIVPTAGMPPAIAGEFALATGTCMVTMGPRDVWFGTATPAGFNARVFHSRDGGLTWDVATTPIPGDPAFGITSLSFRDRLNGLAVGGGLPDFSAPSVVAVTTDGGETWSQGGSPPSFRSSIAWLPNPDKQTAVTVGPVGPAGSDLSTDGGQTWSPIPLGSFEPIGVNCMPYVVCWAVGGNGIAAELVLTKN